MLLDLGVYNSILVGFECFSNEKIAGNLFCGFNAVVALVVLHLLALGGSECDMWQGVSS